MKNSRKSSPLNQERSAWYSPREQLQMSEEDRQQAYSDNARLLGESMFFTPMFGGMASMGANAVKNMFRVARGKNIAKPATGMGYGKYTQHVDDLYNNPSHPLNPLATPLNPNFTPVNPRPLETIMWEGGRQMVKPGSPKPYSSTNPLWPQAVDEAVYPRNWRM